MTNTRRALSNSGGNCSTQRASLSLSLSLALALALALALSLSLSSPSPQPRSLSLSPSLSLSLSISFSLSLSLCVCVYVCVCVSVLKSLSPCPPALPPISVIYQIQAVNTPTDQIRSAVAADTFVSSVQTSIETNGYSIQVCTELPKNARLTEAGLDCSNWICVESYYKAGDACVACSTALQDVCKRTPGLRWAACTATQDEECKPCDETQKPRTAKWTDHSECAWQCQAGFSRKDNLCTPPTVPADTKFHCVTFDKLSSHVVYSSVDNSYS